MDFKFLKKRCVLRGIPQLSSAGAAESVGLSFFLSASVWLCGHRQSQTAAHTYLGGYLIKSGLQECWVNKDQINK